MSTATTGLLVIAGVGDGSRGDDGVGPVVARIVRDVLAASTSPSPSRTRVAEVTDPAALLELWDSATAAVVVDAILTGAQPGTISVRDVRHPGLPAQRQPASSHGLGVAATVELARVLGRLPDITLVVGVEGESFAPAVGLSPPVRRAVPQAVDTVLHLADNLVRGGNGFRPPEEQDHGQASPGPSPPAERAAHAAPSRREAAH